MARFDLTDTHWERRQPLLPPEHSGKPGHPYCDHRRVINGILWVLCTGAPWADMPERYGPHQTAYDRYFRWRNNGIFLARCHSGRMWVIKRRFRAQIMRRKHSLLL